MTVVHTTVSLGRLVTDDDGLYRVVQGLLALGDAPGRRDVLVRRAQGRWEAIGQRARLIEHPPAPLALDADLPHAAHLAATLRAPLAVESAAWMPRAALQDVFLVDVAAVPVLRGAVSRVAAALDDRQHARAAAWWSRRGREAEAERQVPLALAALWEAASLVPLTPLR